MLVYEWASTALKLQIELLRLAFSRQTGGMTAHNEYLLRGFPQDICTAQKPFDIEVTTYMAWPTCSATYCTEKGKILPINCDWKQYLNEKPCGTEISKLVLWNSNGDHWMVQVPI